ncbi:MAG: methionyl-tRNA formyltransferase, partial [Fidelibacterota bacterium]
FAIDWNSNSDQIHNKIRAFSPYPGAYTMLNNQRVKLFESEIIISPRFNLLPGEINIVDSKLVIGTSKGAISINSLQISGKKVMPVNQFINGYNIKNGQFFK